MKNTSKFLVAILVAASISTASYAQGGASPSVSNWDKYWIFFKDKPNAAAFGRIMNEESAERYLVSNGILTERAIERREKVLPPSEVVSVADFPVYSAYLDSIRSEGLEVVGTSRWFNGAVVAADSADVVKAERFSFVVGIKRIVAYTDRVKLIHSGARPRGLMKLFSSSPPTGDSTFYGPSMTQLALSGIPQVQDLGITGRGVIIGMLDAGFRWETHDALKNIKIVGEYDFIQHDSVTENQPNNNPPDAPDQDSHGTMTLSLIGGYAPGDLIGASYGSSFLLAKTEYVPVTDYKWEEDNWVEGLEWMEARGVDVVSSSVGYDTFVDSSGAVDSAESYFFWRGDFNGKKSIASRAATRAAELGVVVVQAMGNRESVAGIADTLLVPADADSIISVGAVDPSGELAYFSLTGPTSDGRIKPDLVADGVDDYVATVPGPDTYTSAYSGTSFSTPITAGIASLILSVRPDYTPMQVIDLLKSTAVQYQPPTDSNTLVYPNNFYGWGIVNAWNAIKKIGFVGSNDYVSWAVDSTAYLAVKAFSTSGINVALSKAYYSYDGVDYSAAPVFRTDTANQFAFSAPEPSSPTGSLDFYFNLVDSAGNRLDVPYYGKSKPFDLSAWKLTPLAASESYRLYDNFPNPFTNLTHVGFILKNQSQVAVDVYDILGRKIRRLFYGSLPAGYDELTWNGLTDSGTKASSGVYLIRISVNGVAKTLKTLLLK